MPSTTVEPISNFETNNTGRRSRDVAETRTSRGRAERRPVGRYDGQKALLLPTGVGQVPFERASAARYNEGARERPNAELHRVPSAEKSTIVGAVVDPMGNGVGRIQASINRKVDILELEFSHKRISEAAYLTGRILQERFERVGSVGGCNWMGGSKQDPMVQHELRVLHAIISAEDVTKTLARLRARLGHIDSRLIQRVLGERMAFAQCAEVTGRNGERGASYIATRFREAMEDLAEAWTAKGALQPSPDDKHLAASEGMVERQRQSMLTGPTAARRAEEAREATKRAAMERKANPARRG